MEANRPVGCFDQNSAPARSDIEVIFVKFYRVDAAALARNNSRASCFNDGWVARWAEYGHLAVPERARNLTSRDRYLKRTRFYEDDLPTCS